MLRCMMGIKRIERIRNEEMNILKTKIVTQILTHLLKKFVTNIGFIDSSVK